MAQDWWFFHSLCLSRCFKGTKSSHKIMLVLKYVYVALANTWGVAQQSLFSIHKILVQLFQALHKFLWTASQSSSSLLDNNTPRYLKMETDSRGLPSAISTRSVACLASSFGMILFCLVRSAPLQHITVRGWVVWMAGLRTKMLQHLHLGFGKDPSSKMTSVSWAYWCTPATTTA